MKYIDQKSRTVYEDIEVEVNDGITYFHSWNEDGEPEHYYKLAIKKDAKFEVLYNIYITKLLNYGNNYAITYKEENDYCLPYYLRGYFSGQEKKEIITEEEFNKVKQEILKKL